MNIGEGAGEILIKLLHVFFRALLDAAIFTLKKWENRMERQPKTEKRVNRISKVRTLIKKLQIKKLEDQNKEIKEGIKKIEKNLEKADKNIERYEINNEISKVKNEIEINKNYLEALKKGNGDNDLINVVERKLKDSQSKLEQHEKRFTELGNKIVSLESYNLALDKRSEYSKLLSINGDEINNNLKRMSILEDQINRLEKKEEKPEKVLQELDKLKDRKDTINRYLNDQGIGKTEKERLLNEIDKIQDAIVKIEYKLNPDSYIENRYKHLENNNQEQKSYAKEKERNRNEEEKQFNKEDKSEEKKQNEKNKNIYDYKEDTMNEILFPDYNSGEELYYIDKSNTDNYFITTSYVGVTAGESNYVANRISLFKDNEWNKAFDSWEDRKTIGNIEEALKTEIDISNYEKISKEEFEKLNKKTEKTIEKDTGTLYYIDEKNPHNYMVEETFLDIEHYQAAIYKDSEYVKTVSCGFTNLEKMEQELDKIVDVSKYKQVNGKEFAEIQNQPTKEVYKEKVDDKNVKEFIQTASDVELMKAANEILNNMEEMVKKNPELKNDPKFMETGKRMYGLLKKQKEFEKEKHKEVNLKQNEILKKGAER